MQKRGKKSPLDLKVIDGDFAKHRPPPPADLSDRQREIWTQTTTSEPQDYFNTSALQALLKAYCCHLSEIERMTEIVNQFQTSWIKNSEGVKRYRELLKCRGEETRALATVATKLRLTNQSRYTPQAAATASRNATRGIRPWEE